MHKDYKSFDSGSRLQISNRRSSENPFYLEFEMPQSRTFSNSVLKNAEDYLLSSAKDFLNMGERVLNLSFING